MADIVFIKKVLLNQAHPVTSHLGNGEKLIIKLLPVASPRGGWEGLIVMSKYESGVKQVPHPQQLVYDMLSDLNNIDRIKDRIPADKIQDLTFDHDTVSVNVPPVGNITLRIIDREEPKCIKFETANSPVPFNLWVQLLPVTDATCKMRVTVKADIPVFLKPMIGSKLQDGVDKIAEALAMLPY